MTVIDLAAERRNRRPIEGCDRCERMTDGVRCFPHQLFDLATDVREREADHADELLIATTDLDALATDVLTVIDGILGECLTESRSADG